MAVLGKCGLAKGTLGFVSWGDIRANKVETQSYVSSIISGLTKSLHLRFLRFKQSGSRRRCIPWHH